MKNMYAAGSHVCILLCRLVSSFSGGSCLRSGFGLVWCVVLTPAGPEVDTEEGGRGGGMPEDTREGSAADTLTRPEESLAWLTSNEMGDAEMVAESETGLSDPEVASDTITGCALCGKEYFLDPACCVVVAGLLETTLAVLMTGPCLPATEVPLTMLLSFMATWVLG